MASRPIWIGFISFGLVNIPVQIYSAESKSELRFHLFDSSNHAKVRYQRVNEVTGKEVPWNNIIKGYEYAKDNYVFLDAEDFAKASVKATKYIDIEDFVQIEEIHPIYFYRPYYIVPDKYGERGYALLRDTLQKTNKAGLSKVVIRSKQYLAIVFPYQDRLLLNILRFQNELKALEEIPFADKAMESYKISPREMKMAVQLIEGMSTKWEPQKYHDEYQERLLQWIMEKSKHKKYKRTRKSEEKENIATDNLVDFSKLLSKSLERTNGNRLHKGKRS
jgi:DNA end-binding protein Ku